jgi:hypothetical protein
MFKTELPPEISLRKINCLHGQFHVPEMSPKMLVRQIHCSPISIFRNFESNFFRENSSFLQKLDS